LAGVIGPAWQGSAKQHTAWAPLVQETAGDKRLSCGLAPIFNWCASQAITPEGVNDAVVQRFHNWLENRTLRPKPRDVVRRVPHLWEVVRSARRGRRLRIGRMRSSAGLDRTVQTSIGNSGS